MLEAEAVRELHRRRGAELVGVVAEGLGEQEGDRVVDHAAAEGRDTADTTAEAGHARNRGHHQLVVRLRTRVGADHAHVVGREGVAHALRQRIEAALVEGIGRQVARAVDDRRGVVDRILGAPAHRAAARAGIEIEQGLRPHGGDVRRELEVDAGGVVGRQHAHRRAVQRIAATAAAAETLVQHAAEADRLGDDEIASGRQRRRRIAAIDQGRRAGNAVAKRVVDADLRPGHAQRGVARAHRAADAVAEREGEIDPGERNPPVPAAAACRCSRCKSPPGRAGRRRVRRCSRRRCGCGRSTGRSPGPPRGSPRWNRCRHWRPARRRSRSPRSRWESPRLR